MYKPGDDLTLQVAGTTGVCPAGEKAAALYLAEGCIPVLSCDGACIRGEIARQAAHMVAAEPGFARACHGETFTVPHSTMADWVQNAEQVVVIDGCFLRCHGRILQNLLQADRLVEFNAHGHYKKYTDLIEIDDVPLDERMDTARDVADWVLGKLA